MNFKVFNLMSRTNETRYAEFQCRLDVSVYNNKQSWNNDKCRCEFKELIEKEICDEGSIFNPINCE